VGDDEENLKSLVKIFLKAKEDFMVVTCKDTDEGYGRMLNLKQILQLQIFICLRYAE
jgi:hypothetical protein